MKGITWSCVFVIPIHLLLPYCWLRCHQQLYPASWLICQLRDCGVQRPWDRNDGCCGRCSAEDLGSSTRLSLKSSQAKVVISHYTPGVCVTMWSSLYLQTPSPTNIHCHAMADTPFKVPETQWRHWWQGSTGSRHWTRFSHNLASNAVLLWSTVNRLYKASM